MFVANTDALEEFFESANYSVNAKKKKKVPEILQYRQIYKPNTENAIMKKEFLDRCCHSSPSVPFCLPPVPAIVAFLLSLYHGAR